MSSSESDTISEGRKNRVYVSAEHPVDEKHPYQEDELELVKHLSERFDGSFTDEDLEIIAAHIDDATTDEAIETLKEAVKEHRHDPCVEQGKLDLLNRLTKGPLSGQTEKDWADAVKFEAFLIRDWSIYPEVRAATRPIDEVEEACETLPVYIIGIFWACAGSCLTTFFANRFPSISIAAGAIQLLIVGSGRLWCRLLPVCSIPLPFGRKIIVNSGSWTFKQQHLTTLAMTCSMGRPYSIWTIVAQRNENFYGFTDGNFGYAIMLTLSSQMMGFGVAGIMRSFLVYPKTCVWFAVLPTIVLNRTLIEKEERLKINGWKLLRWEAFAVVGVFAFCWYWVTSFAFQALAYFDWPAWIAPTNTNLQAITGSVNGLGLGPIPTFDWNTMDMSAMVTPFYSSANQFFGTFIGFIAIVIIWYTNVGHSGYLPINSNSLYDNTAKKFQVSKVLDSRGNLDPEKYQKYSLPFYSAGNLSVYGSSFMVYPAVIVYAILNYGTMIWESCKAFSRSVLNPGSALSYHNDRYTIAQRKYREVPEWWFLSILFAAFGLAVATVEVYKFTNTPVWTIAFGAILSIVFTIPFGILYASSNMHVNVNVLIELIIGYALPGNGNALMISKAYATEFNTQTDDYISNQASGHYTGIPPRSLFRVQMLAVVCNTFVQVGIIIWQLNGGIADMCSSDNKQHFLCQGSRTYFNAAILWGTIGPKKVFDGLYPTMKYTFLIGAVAPILFWAARKYLPELAQKVWPKLPAGVKKVVGQKPWKFYLLVNSNELLWMGGAINWVPYNFMYTLSNFYLAIIFNWFIKKRYPLWWTKYNYILWNAMKVGTAWAALFCFFATGYHHVVEPGGKNGWWGNNVYSNTNDALGKAVRLVLPSGGHFGPDPGTYP